MVFSSLVFLFIFLPAFMGAYYLAPARRRSAVILAGSCIFYGWWRVDFLFLLLGVTLWNYLVARRIVFHLGKDPRRARRWMKSGVALNLLTLGLFKYFNFGLDNISAIFGETGAHTFGALRFILPVGISFYTFQAISFLVDIHRGDAPPPRRFSDFAAFQTLFPQLIAGPVLRYKDLAGQFRSRVHDFDRFSLGAYRFMAGFSKKVLVADTVAVLVEKTFMLPEPGMADAWLGALAYTVQLYFDFSGYSDMAVGLGLMMGFRFIENFDHPYTSRSITEFWRRWHISLSTWLRDYLYIPLGGNRRGRARTYANIFLTMLLGGLWHGANWTFVIWGAWHGGIMVLERAAGRATRETQPFGAGQAAAMLSTMFLVVLGWVMFRAPDVPAALAFYKAMFGMAARGGGLSDAVAWQVTGASVTALAAGILLACAAPVIERRTGVKLRESRHPALHAAAIILFLLAVVKLAASSYSPFLYFQF